MEIILAVLRPKQNTSSHDYRPKLYEILLLDHKSQSGDKVKPTKFLPAFPLTSSEEEPRDEVLTNLYQLTGGEHHGGIKGERALMIPWNNKEYRESLSRFCLYCVPVNAREKLSRSFVEKLASSPGFYSLDSVIDSLNNNSTNYRPPTRTFITQLESWLKDKHTRPGSVDILFRNRAEYRVKYSVNNPAFLPSRFDLPLENNGIRTTENPEEMRLTANEALAKMLAIEKCEIVKINPLFGSGLPYKTKVNNVVTNLYWGSAAPDYDTVTSRRSSTASSIEGYHINLDRYRLHKLAADGNNIIAIRDFLKQGYTYVEQDPQGWTPMHWASWHNNGEVIKVLLEHGCSPNIVNNSGDSPLHIAARYGHVRVAEILLRHREINLELLDKEGKTALGICEQKRSRTEQHQQIANLLRSFYNQSSPIQVFLMDGTMRMLRLANGDKTTVHQLNLQLLDEYGLPERPYADIFTIWICSESLELQLKQEHKPMEHLVSWKRIVGMLTEGDPNKEDPILKWRRNAKIGLDEERTVKHPQAIHLLFHEAYQNYIRALYPCKDQDVLTFASILIYMNQKEFDVSAAKSYLNSKNLPSLVPAPMLKAKSSNWSTRIHHHYKEFGARLVENPELKKSSQKLQLVLEDQFLNFCRNLTVYGSAFFTGNLLSQQGRTGHNQTPCHIGVNDVGIHVINSQTRVMLQSFKYTEIEWRLPEVNALEIKVVRLENKVDKNMSRNMFLKIRTKQAGLIDHLMKKLAQMHAARDRSVDLIYTRH